MDCTVKNVFDLDKPAHEESHEESQEPQHKASGSHIPHQLSDPFEIPDRNPKEIQSSALAGCPAVAGSPTQGGRVMAGDTLPDCNEDSSGLQETREERVAEEEMLDRTESTQTDDMDDMPESPENHTIACDDDAYQLLTSLRESQTFSVTKEG